MTPSTSPMKPSTEAFIADLVRRYPALQTCKDQVTAAVQTIVDCYQNGGKVLTCGNGGSAADALHIVGELMKAFVLPRKLPTSMQQKFAEIAPTDAQYLYDNLQGALPAISLVSEISTETAFANDMAPDLSFAQQVYGYGNAGDVLLGISTSGNSANVLHAAHVARAKGVKVIGLTGGTGGKLVDASDVAIVVPETETYKIQEFHLPIYHALCLAVEHEFFGSDEA